MTEASKRVGVDDLVPEMNADEFIPYTALADLVDELCPGGVPSRKWVEFDTAVAQLILAARRTGQAGVGA